VDLTVLMELREAEGQLEQVENSLREAAAGLQAHDRLRMVFEQDLAPEGAPPQGVRLRERQEFVFIGEPTVPGPGTNKPMRQVIRVTRAGESFDWTMETDDAGSDHEVEMRTIIINAPQTPQTPRTPGAPAPPVPPAAPSPALRAPRPVAPPAPAPFPPSAAPALPSIVSIPPADLSATLRETVRELAGGREVTVVFDPRVVEYYRLVGQGRAASSGPDRMVALYEIKLAPGVADDAVVAALQLNNGGRAGVLSRELKRAEFAASMEQASAGLKAGALSAQVTAALEKERSLQHAEVRRLAGEARRLAAEKVLMERQAEEFQRLAEIAAERLAPQPK